jgi:uncharacterized membrane protein YfcA
VSSELLCLAVAFAGGLVQSGVGIGFSIVVGPVLVLALGAKAAVPLLLLLNLLVSVVAVIGFRRADAGAAFLVTLIASLAGIALGTVLFPYLSETLVTAAMAVLLLSGAAIASVRPRRSSPALVAGAGLLAGAATAWTATPGPVMALGFVMSGYSGEAVRRLVQPIALITYGVAFAAAGPSTWVAAAEMALTPALVLGAIAGSAVGLAIGPRLPAALLILAIRALAAIAGCVLLARALAA